MHFSWDVNLLCRHAPLARLRVHAEVAVLEGVACCVERDRDIPGKHPAKEAVLLSHCLAADATLIGLEAAQICQLSFLSEEDLLGLLRVNVVSQHVHEVVELYNI